MNRGGHKQYTFFLPWPILRFILDIPYFHLSDCISHSTVWVVIEYAWMSGGHAALTKLNTCLQYVQWMALIKLKISPDKTEFIVWGYMSHN